MKKITDEISWPEVDIVFAPHHGRDSGKIPALLDEILTNISKKCILYNVSKGDG